MDRRDRDRYDRNDYGHDYSGYRDYDRNDEHYHSARNLTDQFEQEYQQHRGGRRDNDLNRVDHTYHEGNMGDFYERRRREVSGYRDNADYDRDRNRNDFGSFNNDRDRYRNNRNDFRRDQDRYRGDQDRYRGDQDNYRGEQTSYRGDWARSREQQGSRRDGYMMSNSNVPYRRHETSGNERNRGGGYDQDYNTGLAERYRGSRYSGRGYIGGPGIRNEDDRYNSDRRSYSQDTYY